jgi:hypothetical protein
LTPSAVTAAGVKEGAEGVKEASERLKEGAARVRDQTRGKSDICPVHKVKMPAKEVPVQFGLPATFLPEFRKLKAAEFPFAEEFISGGCVLDDDPLFPETGKVFVCPKCVAAWNRWLEAAKKKVEESKSK